jgi:cytochrome c553
MVSLAQHFLAYSGWNFRVAVCFLLPLQVRDTIVNPFRRKKPNAKRKEPRRTVGERLHGQAKTDRRREIFERSGGKCEAEKVSNIGFMMVYVRCEAPITWETMEWSHKAHGARKSDSMAGGIASCKECHRNNHNAGGKPNPRKPGRVMRKNEAMAYLESRLCFCGSFKIEKSVFCLECLGKLSDQQRLDLEKLEHDDFLKCMAECENTILQYKTS